MSKMVEIAGTGSYQYSLPTDWQEEISKIKSIEYPRRGKFLTSADFTVFKAISGERLLLINHAPQVGETIWVTYIV